MAIAANKMPTTRDITVDIDKVINLDAHAENHSSIPDINITTAIAVVFCIDPSKESKFPKSIIEVIAPGPAKRGIATGLADIRIMSSERASEVSAERCFLACRLPFTISTAIKNNRAPPAMLKEAGEIFK